eukprot:4652938-Alexandrium_andersonii.AAC.1
MNRGLDAHTQLFASLAVNSELAFRWLSNARSLPHRPGATDFTCRPSGGPCPSTPIPPRHEGLAIVRPS